MPRRARALIGALALTLLHTVSPGPAAAQERGRLDRALTAPTGPVGEAVLVHRSTAPPLVSGVHLPAAVRATGATPPPRPESPAQASAREWGWEAVALAVGGALTVGALTEYVFGEGRLGMTGGQAGAFAGGIVLASWGGIRLSGGLD